MKDEVAPVLRGLCVMARPGGGDWGWRQEATPRMEATLDPQPASASGRNRTRGTEA